MRLFVDMVLFWSRLDLEYGFIAYSALYKGYMPAEVSSTSLALASSMMMS